MLLEINKPHHGWLPIHLDLEGFRVDLTASNVLNDPIEELLKVLRLCWSGGEGVEEVALFEEPGGCGLEFTCATESPNCQVRVFTSWNWSWVNKDHPPQLKHESELDRQSVGSVIATCINDMLRTTSNEVLSDWNPDQTYARTFSEIQQARTS